MTAPSPLRRLDEIRMAFLILSRIPVGQIKGDLPGMAQSAWAWPVVGLVIGALSALVRAVGQGVGLPPLLAASLALGAGILATGALHEDGLADVADGFGGGRDRARTLEIMRDSRIGSYGALALVLSVLLRAGALASLGACTGALALVGLGAASRAGLPLMLRLLPAARDNGLGHAASGVTPASARVAIVIGLLALLPLGPVTAAKIALFMTLATGSLAVWAKDRLGGQTGDVLGAMCQLAEIAGWLVLAALMTAG